MSNFAHVFSPFQFGNVVVKNRIELAPACHMLATADGQVTRELVAYYQNMARGGAGIVTVGESPVDFEHAKGHEYQLNLGDDGVIGGLSVMAEAVHRYGAKLSVEIGHNGRTLFNKGKNPLGPSPIPTKRERLMAALEGRETVPVIPMTKDMIDTVVGRFADAAERCLRAGLEMVMIHGGHGHLIASFLSPDSNKRTDDYGGSLENRARFAREVLTAVRNRVGRKLAVEYRISASELIPGGMHEEETIEFVKMITDKIDLLHVSAGLLGDPSTAASMIQPTYFAHCFNVHFAGRFKKALGMPIVTVGSITDLAMAEEIIAAGDADIVAMARAIIADPAIVNKTRRGEPDAVRPCLRCSTCNQITGDYLWPIRCAVNPVLGRELEYPHILPAPHPKKVLIIGGGPAGMEAALTASARGHAVRLFEKNDRLGGNLILAAAAPFKADMRRYLDWLVGQTEKAPGVTVRLQVEATPAVVAAEKPDVLIVAVGAEAVIPDLPGMDRAVRAGDVHLGTARVGETVVVAGGGLTGCETALHLAQQGKKVTVVDMVDETQLAADAPVLLKFGLMELLAKYGVAFVTEAKLEEITGKGAVVIDKSQSRREIPADTVVVSFGFKSRAHAFADLAPDVYVIGDARKAKNLMQAIHDGFNVAVEV